MSKTDREQKCTTAINLSDSLEALKKKGSERDVGYIAGLIDGLVRAEQKEGKSQNDKETTSTSSQGTRETGGGEVDAY